MAGVCLLSVGVGVVATSVPMAGADPTSTARHEPVQDGRGSGPANPGARVGFEWWNDPGVRRDLKLSDEKAKKIDQIYQSRVRSAQPWADRWYAEREKLDRMTKERNATQEEYRLQVAQVEALRSRISETRLVMLYNMSLELSPDQFAKLQQIFDARMRGNMGNNGRGENGRGSSGR
jgi:Spy/CpxP family protein refolding chaperone